jgi:single-stranded-DNA-specific exonuclease
VTAAFLNVERSARGFRWLPRLQDQRLAAAMSQRYDIPDLVARVLAARNVPLDEVEGFLNPTLRGLMPAPSSMRDLEKGAARLAAAIARRESIGIISDYDVDGISSAALLIRFLRSLGHDADVYIPDRISEGYGPSQQAVECLRVRGTRLLLTLDCGVQSHDPLAHAAEHGLETIIVDHHLASPALPQAVAVINPNRQDDVSSLGHLCAAGVTLLLMAATNRSLRQNQYFNAEREEPNLLRWLELVALATVCDVVPLKGLNRAYVTQGLKVMARRENVGIAALADVAGLKRRPDTYALGFIIGPRLNAAGRIGHATAALDLLLTDDRAAALSMARQLDEMNRKRQSLEMRVVEDAKAQAEASLGVSSRAPVLIVSSYDWHPGVVGLAAARLKESFHLPAFVLAGDKKKNLASGSGRSIAGVDLGSAVQKALEAGIIEKGGGHAMAAGLTVKIDRLQDLRAFMEEHLRSAVDAARQRCYLVDGALTASGATLDLIELLEQAGPYGQSHPAPVFVFPAHRVVYADAAGSDHVRCTLAASDGARLKAIAFRAMGTDLGEMLLSERDFPLHVAGRLVVDEWANKRQPALQIEDAAPVRPA